MRLSIDTVSKDVTDWYCPGLVTRNVTDSYSRGVVASYKYFETSHRFFRSAPARYAN